MFLHLLVSASSSNFPSRNFLCVCTEEEQQYNCTHDIYYIVYTITILIYKVIILNIITHCMHMRHHFPDFGESDYVWILSVYFYRCFYGKYIYRKCCVCTCSVYQTFFSPPSQKRPGDEASLYSSFCSVIRM